MLRCALRRRLAASESGFICHSNPRVAVWASVGGGRRTPRGSDSGYGAYAYNESVAWSPPLFPSFVRHLCSKPDPPTSEPPHPLSKQPLGSAPPPPPPPSAAAAAPSPSSADTPSDLASDADASSRTVWMAFFGNSAITLLKAGVWLRTGSSAMLAETLHTLADTLNQAFLILGLTQSRMSPDTMHQYGYGRAAFFWALVSALGLFWCGAGVSVVHGIDKLINPPAMLEVGMETWLVLGASLAIDGAVLYRASNEIVRRAAQTDARLRAALDGGNANLVRKTRAIFRHLRTSQDPFISAVFLEDSAACAGVVIAGAGIGLTQFTGMVVWDTLASVIIGGMLGNVAFRLVQMNKKFLLGQAVDTPTVTDITGLIRARPAVDHITDVQTQWVGPSSFAYKAEVDFDGTYLAARLLPRYERLFLSADNLEAELPLLLAMYAEDVTRLVERELQEVEDIIRIKYPGAVFIELEPDSVDANKYMMDSMGDKKFRSVENAAIQSLVSKLKKKR